MALYDTTLDLRITSLQRDAIAWWAARSGLRRADVARFFLPESPPLEDDENVDWGDVAETVEWMQAWAAEQRAAEADAAAASEAA